MDTVEKLLNQKEARDSEFRSETRDNFNKIFEKLDMVENKASSLDGKIKAFILIGGGIGGAIMSFLEKKFIG